MRRLIMLGASEAFFDEVTPSQVTETHSMKSCLSSQDLVNIHLLLWGEKLFHPATAPCSILSWPLGLHLKSDVNFMLVKQVSFQTFGA